MRKVWSNRIFLIKIWYWRTLQQNVSIPPIFDSHFYNSSMNIGSIYFFLSSDMHQSHHLFDATLQALILHLIFFFKCFGFFKFSMFDKKSVLTREKIKRNMLHKNAVLATVKIFKKYAWQKELFWIQKKLKQFAWKKIFFK